MAITLEANNSTQQALEKIVAPKTKTQRFRPDEKLLRFLCLGAAMQPGRLLP